MSSPRTAEESGAGSVPLVSVVVACFNAAAHLEAAVRSALDQTLDDLEVIIADDRSTDDSVAIAHRLAADDPRIVVVTLSTNGGPAAARNAAIARARGKWIAILDSDDRFHPDRLRALILLAQTGEADLVADDLLVFGGEAGSGTHRFLAGRYRSRCLLTLDHYLDATIMFGRRPDLGYLKPIFRADRLRRTDGYDEGLRVGEDDDLVVRLLLDGARYRLVPTPTYFYRKHAQSISHRLSSQDLRLMIDRGAARLHAARTLSSGVRRKLARRVRARRRALNFVELIEGLKHGDIQRSIAAALARPSPLSLLRLPLGARLRRWGDTVRRRVGRLLVRNAPRLPAELSGESRPLRYHAEATAADMLGLIWLIDSVWPIVLRSKPDATLVVSGTVARHLPTERPFGVVAGARGEPPPDDAVLAMPNRIDNLRGQLPGRSIPPRATIVATSHAQLTHDEAARAIIRDDAASFAAASLALISTIAPARTAAIPAGGRWKANAGSARRLARG